MEPWFKSSVTGSSWCNGAVLAWSLVSGRSANWGLSGVSGDKHLRLLCYHHPKMELSLDRIIRKQESAFSSIHHSLLDVRKSRLCMQPLVTGISWFSSVSVVVKLACVSIHQKTCRHPSIIITMIIM